MRRKITITVAFVIAFVFLISLPTVTSLSEGHILSLFSQHQVVQAQPETNTITITSTPSGASFSLSGPASYSGTTPWSTSNAPAGSYTITWGAMAGYTTPAPQTYSLNSGGSTFFSGQYQSAVQTGTISVSSNPSGASFSLSGPASYSGTTPWSTSNAPAGSYTITWGAMAGYATPAPQTYPLLQGGTVYFSGQYQVIPQTDDVYWLAKALMSEASIGTRDERIAVGWSILNRLDSGRFGNTIEEIVKGAYAYNQEPTQEIRTLAQELWEREFQDSTGGATHFFSPRSMTSGYGPYRISGTELRVIIPYWAIPKPYSRTSPPPSDWEIAPLYKTIDDTEWIGGLNNVRNYYFMFYRPTRILEDTTPQQPPQQPAPPLPTGPSSPTLPSRDMSCTQATAGTPATSFGTSPLLLGIILLGLVFASRPRRRK
jgi:hypothetical protein